MWQVSSTPHPWQGMLGNWKTCPTSRPEGGRPGRERLQCPKLLGCRLHPPFPGWVEGLLHSLTSRERKPRERPMWAKQNTQKSVLCHCHVKTRCKGQKKMSWGKDVVLRGAQVIRRPEPEESGPLVQGQLIPELSMCEGREDQQEPFPGSIREKPNKTNVCLSPSTQRKQCQAVPAGKPSSFSPVGLNLPKAMTL